MTANQIAYWNLQETERSNLARESETHRSNVANETETNRSNLARETETNRANLAKEKQNRIDSWRNYEINLRNLFEKRRATKVSEQQRNRELDIGEKNASTQQLQASNANEVNQYNAVTSRMNANEQRRSHLVSESQNSERLRQQAYQTQTQNYFTSLAQSEVNRANLVREDQNLLNLQEQSRANRVKELLQAKQNAYQFANLREVAQHNRAMEYETHRSNVAREMQQVISTIANVATSIASAAMKGAK